MLQGYISDLFVIRNNVKCLRGTSKLVVPPKKTTKSVLISSSETFAKRRAIFLSVRKTVNSQGYSQSKRAKIAIH